MWKSPRRPFYRCSSWMKNDISVYIHIPFCVRKCLYCDFPSIITDPGKEKAYLNALLKEIEHCAGLLKDKSIRTVYFGGGTPSVTDPSYIKEILEALRGISDFNDSAEISMELNPGTVDENRLEIYLGSGINRLSMGLQSANDNELKALGRIHTCAEFKESFRLLRKAGAGNINIDIMTGIPYQTFNSLKNTFNEVTALEPEHISVYTLIMEPGTPFYEMGEDKLNLPSEEDGIAFYEYTEAFLESKGYKRYEISNYAKNGYECRHNLVYWDCGDYLGFGSSAASRIGERRYSNVRDVDEYIRNPVGNRAEDLRLTKKELMSEVIFMGLRKTDGISIRDFEDRFGVSVFKAYGKELEKYMVPGLILSDGKRLYFSKRGMDVSNMILADFV